MSWRRRALWALNLMMSIALVVGIFFWLRPYGVQWLVGGLVGIPVIGWCVLTLLGGEPPEIKE